jgi:hypothetical protein
MAWKLRIEFRDMFFLIMYKNKHGAVVLLPSKGHSATVALDKQEHAYGLYRTQVTIQDASGSWFGKECQAPGKQNLVSANDIFGRFDIPDLLIKNDDPSIKDVPPALNARVFLSGGQFTELEARDPHARFEWTFPKTNKKTKLTDQLAYEVDMPDGDATMFIRYHDGRIRKIPLIGGKNHTLYFWNRDIRDVGEKKNLPKKKYTLTEYETLHRLVGLPEGHVPEGDYPDGIPNQGAVSPTVEEPICGGEQGEPDPPPPDPDAP